MSQFWYYSLASQWWDLLDAIIKEHHLRFVADEAYDSAQCPYYDAPMPELKAGVALVSRIHLLGPAFSKAPVFLRRQETGKLAGKYFVDDSRGGPSLDLVRPGELNERGMTWFGPGWLSYRRVYWDETLTRPYRAPKEVNDAFRAIKRTMQNQMLEQKIAGQMVWATPPVWDLYSAGRAALPVAGRCYTVGGEVPPPSAWGYAR